MDERRNRLRHILAQPYHQALLPNDPGKEKAKGHVFGHSLYYILKREKRRCVEKGGGGFPMTYWYCVLDCRSKKCSF